MMSRRSSIGAVFAMAALAISASGQGIQVAAEHLKSPEVIGVPSGALILGDTPEAPQGYSFDGPMYAPAVWNLDVAATPLRQDKAVTPCLGDKVYVIGGKNDSGPVLDTVRVFDLATKTWSSRTPMTTPRQYAAAAVLDGKIFVIGGHNGTTGGNLRQVEEYDPELDVWTSRQNLPVSRAGPGAVAVDGKIYVFGGTSSSGGMCLQTPHVLEYDPKSNAWIQKGEMLNYNCGAWANDVAGAFNGKIYTFGDSNDFLEYTPATDTWVARQDCPMTPKAGSFYEGLFVVLGGDTGAGYAYDPSIGTWEPIVPKTTPQRWSGLVDAGWRLMAINSMGANPDDLSVDEYYPERLLFLHRKN